ncbi:MAG: Abi family protein, partial [Oscillospiraceae bacterium]|nr:Abi family protein [Oscillospiraceae bacterium]
MDKKFSTTNSQLRKLRSRGLIIPNGSRAKRILEMENYYNLINGYKDLFVDHTYSGIDEKYKDNTNFNELYGLYIFDRELRNVFIRYILEIENNIKSVTAHIFSKKYVHDNYLKIANFDTSIKKWEKNKTQSQKTGEVADLISNLQREVSHQLKKNSPMISHNILTYGYVPLWVLINTLSLGTVSIFYSYMKQKDQNDVGRYFKLKPEELSKILFILSIFRNACAHDERLFNLKCVKRDLKPNSIKDTTIHSILKIEKNSSNNYKSGKNDLFAIVIIFKLMLTKKSFNKFFFSLKELIDRLSKEIKTITTDDVLE